MKQEPIQAYLNLIQKLLSCPRGEENQVLNNSRELVAREKSDREEAIGRKLETIN